MDMEGHAGGAPLGENVICAAATVLARTAARVLDASPGIRLRGIADREGRLEVEVLSYQRETGNYLKALSDYLLVGLRDLESEYPGEVTVLVEDPVESQGE